MAQSLAPQYQEPDHLQVVHIASLLASRLCHDLVNPIGALKTGLDFMEQGDDPELQAHAMNLIKESAEKSIAILEYVRLAFGSSGGWEGDLDMGAAQKHAVALYKFVKADLVWNVAENELPKARARALLNLVLLAEKSVPRVGSSVTFEKTDGVYRVVARGKKAKLSDETVKALSGDDTDLQAKESPAYMAWLLTHVTGDRIQFELVDEETVVYSLTPHA